MVKSQQRYGISQRRACHALGVCRSVQRYIKRRPDDESRLRDDIIRLAHRYGRYGYKRIKAFDKNLNEIFNVSLLLTESLYQSVIITPPE